MWIITAKFDRKKVLACCAGIAAVCLMAAGVVLFRGPAADALATVTGRNGADNADRVAYLQELGWQVTEEPVAVEELLIPREMDETYADYLALQEEQGFDLERYRGKRVKRYSYEITNYPTGETGIQADLLVYQGKIVGGDVLSSSLNGFIHGLERPAAQS